MSEADELERERKHDFDDELVPDLQEFTQPQPTLPDPPSPRRPPRSSFTKSLPKIKLPIFNGDAAEWPRWESLFEALVHSQPDLNNVEKMTHLQSAVTGPPQQLISGMMFDGSQYDDALNSLRNRYGKEDDIVRACLKKVFSHPSPRIHDVSSLEDFQGVVNSTVVTLKSLNFMEDFRSSENLHRVIMKLPLEIRREWGKQAVEIESKKERPTLLHLNEWLVLQLRVSLNYCEATKSVDDRQSRDSKQHSKPSTSKPRSVFSTNVKADDECIRCKSKHPLAECDDFKKNLPDHHKLLHGSKRIYPKTTVKAKTTDYSSQERTVTLTRRPTANDEVLLQVVPIRVYGNGERFFDTFAILDPGSQTSLCCREITDRLDVSGEERTLTLNTINGPSSPKTGMLVQLDVVPLSASSVRKKIKVDEAWSVDGLKIPLSLTRLKSRLNWCHVEDIDISVPGHGDVQVLLGANVIEAVIQHETRIGRPNQPIAVRTDFGWSPTGRAGNFSSLEDTIPRVYFSWDATHENQQLSSLVKDWWQTESFGVKNLVRESQSTEDVRAVQMLEANTRLVNGHYETGLLWKDDDIQLPCNRLSAMKRLKNTECTLKKDPVRAAAYAKTFDDYVEKGYSRKLSETEANQPSPKKWYLPHHAVFNPNKKKIRVVFDAAACYSGVSLNNQLISGPNLLQSLPGVLLRFGQEQVAVIADVEAMYHQVRIAEMDQPALRYFWRNLEDRPPDIYQMLVNIFAARCSASIANYALKMTARDAKDVPQAVHDAVLRDFYMDDFLKSVKTVLKAIEMLSQVSYTVAVGGFRLTKYFSNSREVLAAMPPSDVAVDVQKLPDSQLPKERALGVLWDAENDVIGIRVRVFDAALTRRSLLRLVSSIFDPFGIAAPFLLQAMILVQLSSTRKLDWDADLPEEDVRDWKLWLNALKSLPDVHIVRCYKPYEDEPSRRELHLFCDASTKAFPS
ncbi:uncharacterized protein LOC141909156 [Tubulanus polymorphus]|uniref:uncharacterized protein LOC141909156 n=1 Tax=Tubulanus polymorphus TaxID=672921 RepID=UPI003DA38F17